MIRLKLLEPERNHDIGTAAKFTPCLEFSNIELGTEPQEGDHHGRLAVEQTYGYMFHNDEIYVFSPLSTPSLSSVAGEEED